jgi:hypothetical protein
MKCFRQFFPEAFFLETTLLKRTFGRFAQGKNKISMEKVSWML